MTRQNSLPTPASAGPSFRRRRTVWFFILACIAALFLISTSTTFSPSYLPSYLSDTFTFKTPTIKIAPVVVSEIHGLQHFVINSEGSLSNAIFEAPEGKGWKLDPKHEIDMRIYSSFDNDQDWEKHVKTLEENSPLVVFSKTYCPYSKKAKLLLQSYQLDPPPMIIEVDLRDDTEIIKVILGRLTKHSTFPNIILRGVSLGGSDTLQAMHEQDQLKDVLEKNGIKVKGYAQIDVE